MRPFFNGAGRRGAARCLWLLLGLIGTMLAMPARAAAAEPWLFVSDVHFSGVRGAEPSSFGKDTNTALLASSIAEMRRLAPHPPVIVIPGDFLGHHFKNADALPTMIDLAKRFDAAFPHAQFVISLGNEDSDCGDYGVGVQSAFLHAVADAWEPLVNRNGAAPNFVRTFSRDGFYTARLPIAGVRAVVIDDAFWSPLYHNVCGAQGSPTPESVGELDAALRPGGTERRWIVMHIPPGIDVGTTVNLARHLAIVPFLRPAPRERFVQLASDPARHVEVVITGHLHRFSYRILGASGPAGVPLLITPAISPIYGNTPAFLTADVATDGIIRNLEEHALVDGRWRDIGGLGSLGAGEFTAAALENVQRRLDRNPDERYTYATLYNGPVQWNEINTYNWRSYWCAATELDSTDFRSCLDEGGFSFLTRRGVAVVVVAAGLSVAVIMLFVIAVVRRRRRARVRPL